MMEPASWENCPGAPGPETGAFSNVDPFDRVYVRPYKGTPSTSLVLLAP